MKKTRFIYFLTFIILSISCKKDKENFIISNLSVNNRYLDEYTPKGPDFTSKLKHIKKHRETGQWDNELLDKKTYFEARFIDLDFKILNNTEENIEVASIVAYLYIHFKSKTITYHLPERQFLYNHDEIWKSNHNLTFNTTYLLNDLNEYDKSIFEHKPEKISLTLYINAVNSVGFDNTKSSDLIYNEEIALNNWK